VPNVDGSEVELYGNYNAGAMFAGRRARFEIGLAGRIWITGENMNLSERTVHLVGFAGTCNFGTLRPGLDVRVPLDKNLSDAVDFVLGVSLTKLF
jgi:hypothetical protein